ncbi:MAG: hypothetical protein K8T90_05035 [Planctomycetes bacterium]|nr:hypothetical protein [Planctomycetota bacterium]
MRSRAVAGFLAAGLLATGCGSPQRAQETTSLRFVGTVTSIGMRRTPDPWFRWVVTMHVDEVLSGTYDGSTFAFVVHSPSQEHLREGGRYEIDAERTTGPDYRFIAATARK